MPSNRDEKVKLLSLITEKTSDSIIVRDKKFKITYINKAAEKLFGYSFKELKGKSPDILNAEKNSAKIQAQIYSDLSKGKEVLREGISKRKDGSTFICQYKVLPLKGEHGEVFAYLGIQRDITEKRKAEEELKRSEETLRELDKAKTNFLNIVSHELKTPLTAIYAHLGVLDDLKSNLNQEELSSLDAVRRNSHQLKMLIEDILEMSRIQAGKFELNLGWVDINCLVNHVIKNMKVLSDKKGIILVTKLSTLPRIISDEVRVREILINLIDNAIKFTDKGSVTVETKKEGNSILTNIIDTGIGVKKENLPRLFERFYQVSPSVSRKSGGVGLGLPITKQLVELMGGQIIVKSRYKKGSVFSFRLPVKTKGSDKK